MGRRNWGNAGTCSLKWKHRRSKKIRAVKIKIVATIKALVAVIKEDLEGSRALGKIQDNDSFLNELRSKAIKIGIELSQFLVHFMFYLVASGKGAKIAVLQSKIQTEIPEDSLIGHKFMSVMNVARELVPSTLAIEEEEEEEVLDLGDIINIFMETLLDLHYIPCNIVAGAPVILEDVLSQVLSDMQLLKLRVRW